MKLQLNCLEQNFHFCTFAAFLFLFSLCAAPLTTNPIGTIPPPTLSQVIGIALGCAFGTILVVVIIVLLALLYSRRTRRRKLDLAVNYEVDAGEAQVRRIDSFGYETPQERVVVKYDNRRTSPTYATVRDEGDPSQLRSMPMASHAGSQPGRKVSSQRTAAMTTNAAYGLTLAVSNDEDAEYDETLQQPVIINPTLRH